MQRSTTLLALVLGFTLCTAVRTDDELADAPSWQSPDLAKVADTVSDWLTQQGADEKVVRQAQERWQTADADDPGFDLLESLVETIALVEPRAQTLLETCRAGATPAAAADLEWLDDKELSPLVRDNLRLLCGRSLAQGMYLDEALTQFSGLTTESVQDPASLLFYRGVAHHRLYQKKQGVESLDRLLENRDAIPRRFAVLARLMRSDLEQLKDGSLDDISRRMKDVERRLGLGRANKRVRTIEDEVVKMLDKLIEEEEKKQCQACQSAAGGAQSSRPAPDSTPLGGKGPGEVTKRRIGNSDGWGELPPKQREETMQEIGRDFPAHYREVIEEYFRELAKQPK